MTADTVLGVEAPGPGASKAVLAAWKRLKAAQAASLKASEARSNLSPGTSRARVTTANARWARHAEERDRALADYLALVGGAA